MGKAKHHHRSASPPPEASGEPGAAPSSGNGHDLYWPSQLLEDVQEPGEGSPQKLDRKLYEKELAHLQVELVK